MRTISLLAITFLSVSCHRQHPLGEAAPYFPSRQLLEDGVANKYYVHVNPGPDEEAYTRIDYIYFKLDDGKLQADYYNAGFLLEQSRTFSFSEGRMLVEKEMLFRPFDTSRTVIKEPVFLSWNEADGSGYVRQVRYPAYTLNLTDRPVSMRDTLAENLPARLFNMEMTGWAVSRSDTNRFSWTSRVTYAAGLGFYSLEAMRPEGEYRVQLVEQITNEDFEALKGHGRQRVGYISPANAIDTDSGFAPCSPHALVMDYYNNTPEAGYAGGKRAMRDAIYSRLDVARLEQESGYLTYRFIVNCEGEAGWFVTEQAGLDYREKQFGEETTAHLYQLLSELPAWQPLVHEGKARDAYTYVTFKLKDGKIIEILP